MSEQTAIVEWVTCPSHPNYEVSRLGVVRHLRKGSTQPVYTDKDGYLKVSLRRDGVSKNKSIHRLVLEAFVGPCPPGKECRHINGDPADNRAANLAWATHAENCADRVRHGTQLKGEQHPNARATQVQVDAAFALIDAGWASQRIADAVGVSVHTVNDIKRGRTWLPAS